MVPLKKSRQVGALFKDRPRALDRVRFLNSATRNTALFAKSSTYGASATAIVKGIVRSSDFRDRSNKYETRRYVYD